MVVDLQELARRMLADYDAFIGADTAGLPLHDGGVPRFPVYVGERRDEPDDAPPPPFPPIKARSKRK